MVSNGGGQQDPIVERLIRLELEIKASNERSEERLAASNQRLTDAINLIVESIRQTNQRIDETNQRITETNQRIEDTNRRIEDTNRRIDDTNNRIDDTNGRLDTQTENLRREFRSDFNKLFYTVLGAGAAIIVTVVTAQLFG